MERPTHPIDNLYRVASLHPARVAVHCNGLEYSYESLAQGSRNIGSAFARQGMAGGDRVAVYSPNHQNLILGLFAVWNVGAVWVPVNTDYSPTSVARYLASLQPSWLLYHADYRQAAREIQRRLPSIRTLICIDRHDGDVRSLDELMLTSAQGDATSTEYAIRPLDQIITFFPTSGTTGRPKAIGWSAERVNADMRLFKRLYQQDSHTRLVITPLAHGAFHLAINTLAVAGKVVLMRQFVAAKALELIAEQRVTNMLLPGSALAVLLEHPELNRWKYDSVRDITVAMDAASVQTLRRAVDKFGPCISVIYGQTETGLLTMLDRETIKNAVAQNCARVLRSCGRPGQSVTIAVIDDTGAILPAGEIGELVARTDRVALSKGGWHHTNDLGWFDADGFVHLAGRRDDVININGYKVHPAEIEACISELSPILECAVTAIVEERVGCVLAVVIRPTDDALCTERDVAKHVRAELGAMKVPRLVLFTDEMLPRTRYGRLDRKAVTTRFKPLFDQILQQHDTAQIDLSSK